MRVEGVAAPAAVWAGFDLGADLDARDVEHRLVGVLPVHDVVSRSAIHRVSGSDWPVEQTDRLDTKGYVRPIFEGGCLVLRVGPAAEGLLVPNEVEEPHQCCSGRH